MPVGKLRLQLGKNLFVLDSLTIYRLFYFHTEETTAACRITHQIETVRSSDKRSDTWQVPKITLVSFADVEARHLHQIFQKRHLLFRIFVEFIQIDESHF